jgi:poly(3-hydroxybutyrate) depolymerase
MRAPLSFALPITAGCASGIVALALLTGVPARSQLAFAAPPSVPPGPPAQTDLSHDGRTSALDRLDAEASVPAVDVRLAPSATGVLGAWLVAGPFKAARPALDAAPAGVDEKRIAATASSVLGGERDLGGGKRRPAARWKIVSSGPPTIGGAVQDPGSEGSRTIDLKANLEDAGGSDLVAYAAGRIHVEKPGKHYLLLGVDDGVRVFVDGAVVFSRDDARPVRDDDDLIALDLDGGDHDIVLKLHQRDGAWAFRAKLVDASLAPPVGAYLVLPGTTADDARALAARMSWLVVDRTFDARATPPRYRPVLTVRYPEGAPRGVPLPVAAKLTGVPESSTFDVHPGAVAVTASGVTDLVVALPPLEPWTAASATLESTVAGRIVKSAIAARPQTEQALVRAERALAGVKGDEAWLRPGSLDSVRHLVRRLLRLVARGDTDAEAQSDEARELDRLVANLERGVDPYDGRSGMMRRAVVTPFDGAASELGLYVPPSYRPGDTRKYPLVVGLHGMNSYPMSMMRALFGLDEEKKEPAWKDRHLPPADRVPPVEAFVITPYAHGNTMYREIGEDDVLYMMQWASKTFPIDETRITVTGPSMGGIGSASLPFHFPHVFAAAAPLCGYHSYVIRADIAARPKRPWERVLLEERSNVYWAENGEHLPLWIVHGTRDLPEANSGVLIERYEKLKYSIKHDHPDAGHNVWGITYGELKGFRWLLSQRLDPHPAHVRFRTMRTRYASSAWVTVDELAGPGGWADVDARVKSRTTVSVTSSGAAALSLARDEKLLDAHAPINVTADGVVLAFDEDEALALHKNVAGIWEKGLPPAGRSVKRGHVSGPLRDVFHEPLLFVYASGDEARANERVARGFADRPGIPTAYPVMSDIEFLARGEPLANDRALFLVGRSNKVLAALASAAANAGAPFPMHVDSGAVTLGKERLTGRELGGAFIHPNPARPDRYVVVVAGADVTGTLRALSLPDLVPDFVVWDETLAPARGQIVLGAGALRAAGFFENDWSLPSTTADPLARVARPAPQNEHDATPYLP